MNKLISLVVLIAGVGVLVIGINATHSLGSNLSQFFTGAPTDKSVWLLILGSVTTVVGLTLTMRSWDRPK